jgi:hypothetical protein
MNYFKVERIQEPQPELLLEQPPLQVQPVQVETVQPLPPLESSNPLEPVIAMDGGGVGQQKRLDGSDDSEPFFNPNNQMNQG